MENQEGEQAEMRPTQNFGQTREVVPEKVESYKFSYAEIDEKEAESGHTKEVVSVDKREEDQVWPYITESNPGIKTLLEAFKRNLYRTPKHEMIGSRLDKRFVWQTFTQIAD